MKIEIDFDQKTICIKTPGLTFREIEARLDSIGLKDWKEYKIISDIIPSSLPWTVSPPTPIIPYYSTGDPVPSPPYKVTCDNN